MSSEQLQPPKKKRYPIEVNLDVVTLRVLKGVYVMSMRSSLVLSSALALATVIPAVGLAEQPAVMEAVDEKAAVEALQEGTEPSSGGFKSWAGNVLEKTKAGAGELKDKFFDVDEMTKKKIDDLEEKVLSQRDTIVRLQAELAESKKEVADARYTAGVQHELMLQYSTDLVKYLETMKTK